MYPSPASFSMHFVVVIQTTVLYLLHGADSELSHTEAMIFDIIKTVRFYPAGQTLS